MSFAFIQNRFVVRAIAVASLPLVGLFATSSHAQIVTATTDTTCLAQRAGGVLNCTAEDLSSTSSFTLPLGSCRVGDTYTITTADFTINKGSPARYDIGLFFGQQGNVPGQTTSGNVCSVAAFTGANTTPGVPLVPWVQPTLTGGDGDACWDLQSGAAVIPVTVQNIKVACQPDPTTGNLRIPYNISWRQNTADSCTGSLSVSTDTPSKCNRGVGVASAVTVNGYVRLTKQTVPSGATQSFSFSASGSIPPTPTSFSLSDGGIQYVEMPLNGSSRTLTITEAAAGGVWLPTAGIACTDTSGNPLTSFFTKNEANRTFSVTLSANSNNGVQAAHCTITNSRQTRVRTSKALSPTTDTGRFNLTAGSTTVNNQGHGGTTGYIVVAAGSAQTFSEAAVGPATALANYTTTYQCVNDLTGATVSSGSGATVNFTPPGNTDTTCTFTNTRRQASLTLRKTWQGAVVNDTATLSTSGLTNNLSGFVSTANTANETDAAPALVVYAGETATLSETLGSGNAGLYHDSLACTGAADTNPNDGVSIGTGDSSIVCTYTNTIHSADLAITKTNNQTSVVPGTTTTYQITVTNNGPDPATGATVKDVLPGAPLNCPSSGAVTCSGPAGACPSSVTTIGQLTGAGVALGTLANGDTVTLSFTCNVTN